MVRCGFFQRLRRRGAVLGAVLVYALLLNALATAVFDARAVAAALDPLSNAATCDPAGSGPSRDPIGHKNQHQPDCTLCSSACPMGGMLPALGGGGEVAAEPLASHVLDNGAARVTGIRAPSIYRSDTDAQAPPAIG